MKIDQIFINESDVIRERIENLPVEGCISNYIEYVHSSGEGFEKLYIDRLDKRFKSFIAKIELLRIKDKSLEEMKTMYVNVLWDGYFGISERDMCELIDDYTYHFNSDDLYDYIKQEMKDALDELVDEMNTSKRDSKINELKNNLINKKNALNNIDKEIEDRKKQLSNEITRLEEQLKEIEAC